MMRQGGNEQIKRFFRKLEIENSPVKTLYCSKGANHYRERLKEKVGKIMSGELKSESRVIPHSSRHRNTRSQSAIAELMLNGARSEPGSLNGDKRKSSFEQYHVSFGDGPMGMTISKDFGGRALVSKLVTGGPAERSGVGIRNSHVRRPRSGQVCEFPPRREQRKEPRSGPDFGSPFFWVLFFGEAKKSTSAAGPRPGLPRKKRHIMRSLQFQNQPKQKKP